MSARDRARAPRGVHTEAMLLWLALGALAVAALVFDLGMHAAAALAGDEARLPWNPLRLATSLAGGERPWPDYAAPVTAAVAAATLAVLGLAGLGAWALRPRRSGLDRASAHLARPRDLGRVAGRGARREAARLGVAASPGLPIGRPVGGGPRVVQGWEDVALDIAGPRTGKTTARVIPAIMEAPGAVLVTSNKRDVVDATRAPRTRRGETWVFDPQGLVQEPASWWWNPLSYVTDEVRAAGLADVFAAASARADARTDAFFDPKGQKLVAGLLMAAAAAGRTLPDVYRWVTRPADDEPVAILAAHGHELLAESVRSEILAPDRQRGGVYGTAEKMLGFMVNCDALRWVTPGAGRREFRPAEFVRGSGTLYSLSKEGRGSAGALVAALTMAVTEAAERFAAGSPAGRLPTPLVGVLDEAANVCRWPELPNLYSHYGSRGIVLVTVLQSWSQGVEVWGREGMRKLWSAANVKVYLGGVAEVDFLSDLSHLVGDFTNQTTTVSRQRAGRSVSVATQRERVLEVSDLASLPRGRALVVVSGAPPVLVRTEPWMEGPHAREIAAAIAACDPAGQRAGESA